VVKLVQALPINKKGCNGFSSFLLRMGYRELFFFLWTTSLVLRDFSPIRLHVSLKRDNTTRRFKERQPDFSDFQVWYSSHPRICASQFSRIRRNSIKVKYAYRFFDRYSRKRLRFTLRREQTASSSHQLWRHGNVAPSLSRG
jgi:hypothetical protein